MSPKKLCAAYSARPQCACANHSTQDTASVANFQTVFLSHLELDLTVLFEQQKLQGHAGLRLRLPPASDTGPPAAPTKEVPVSLDVHSALKVSKVELRSSSEAGGHPIVQDLSFEVSPFTRFGEALRFAVPAERFEFHEDAGLKAHEAHVLVYYETTPEAPATTWLACAQTHGKRAPYLFTQGQACLNRSLFPCMDTPAVRFTYEAVLRVPASLTAVMSAERSPLLPTLENGLKVVRFLMPQPIPSYLVALAVGDLVCQRIGPRSMVWCEPSQLEAASYEFDGMPEQYLRAGEKLFGPYRWSTYDILVMPPSFPFGGMENPRMTFVTPCLLTGDRSLGDVIAHEIAHSWFGNLVTNANWSEFWLNEGFTMFAQRRITDEVHGKAFTALEAMTGRKILVDDIKEFGEENVLTRLRCPIEAGVDPEDTYNECPYEKGFAMVSYLHHCVGLNDAIFDEWLGRYADRFAFTSVVAEDMFNFFFESFPEHKQMVDVNMWLHKPGMPTFLPDLSHGEELILPVEDLLTAWQQDGPGADAAAVQRLLQRKEEVAAWVTYQRLHFLDRLLDVAEALPADVVDQLGEQYGFLASHNAEVQLRFGTVLIKKRLKKRYDSYIGGFLRAQGKQKYTLPLYKALIKHVAKLGAQEAEAELELMKSAWSETKDCLHANVRLAVSKAFAADGLAEAPYGLS